MTFKISLNLLMMTLPVALLTLLLVTYVPRVAFCSEDASAKISQAENAISEAFAGTLQAEAAGANITGLLEKLNLAQENLNQAQLAFRNGNLTESIEKAGTSRETALSVLNEASEIKNASIVNGKNVFLFNIVFSLAATSVFLVGLVMVWRWMKRRHFRELAKMKPQVTQNET
jgi:hypothetical protein